MKTSNLAFFAVTVQLITTVFTPLGAKHYPQYAYIWGTDDWQYTNLTDIRYHFTSNPEKDGDTNVPNTIQCTERNDINNQDIDNIGSNTPMMDYRLWVPTQKELEIEESSRLVTMSDLFRKDIPANGVFITEVPRSVKSFFTNYKYVAHCGLSKSNRNMVAIRMAMPHRILPFVGPDLKVFSSVKPPEILVRHWERKLGSRVRPRFTCLTKSHGNTTYVCPYPIEQLPLHQQHVEPDAYYKVLSKRFVSEVDVTQPKIFTNATIPCVVKLTHGMGGTAVFLITNETELQLTQSKIMTTHPDADLIVTEMITDLESPEYSAHFFVDKSGNVTWWEVVELIEDANGHSIGTMWTKNNGRLRQIMEPFVNKVAQALHQNGYYGPAGCDVLHNGRQGYLVDINPRMTCSMPLCLMAREMERRGWSVGVLTRQRTLDGTLDDVIARAESISDGEVVILSGGELEGGAIMAYVAVFSDSREACEHIISNKLPFICTSSRLSRTER
ncbi:uncharacterized protein LOC106150382 [Lingula anatina]|uniref:Uncharacterized protein LOC106150382 n=1 Tax=Lingula anatina TaxID=7574 RepID=A0A1S3GXK4_LINAN|nr:uncharacterized protein LOC106150382 [Lingula anatina]|eukprot:XP_013378590.1 uncharacterized protein LOC106150382 [Lingula anatina]